jgi:small subunit ribosomal protein S13
MVQIAFLNRSVSATQKIGKFISSLYGISCKSSIRICRQIGIFYSDTFDQISVDKRLYIESYLSTLTLGLDLQRLVQNRTTDKVRVGGHTGLRISQNLPSRGQRTKTNAQTVKRKRPGAKKKPVVKKKLFL